MCSVRGPSCGHQANVEYCRDERCQGDSGVGVMRGFVDV